MFFCKDRSSLVSLGESMFSLLSNISHKTCSSCMYVWSNKASLITRILFHFFAYFINLSNQRREESKLGPKRHREDHEIRLKYCPNGFVFFVSKWYCLVNVQKCLLSAFVCCIALWRNRNMPKTHFTFSGDNQMVVLLDLVFDFSFLFFLNRSLSQKPESSKYLTLFLLLSRFLFFCGDDFTKVYSSKQ